MQTPLQLYSLATPNGQKVAIALEMMGLPYQAHTINILKDEQFTDAFVRINPNSKIPALVDPNVGLQPLTIMESGAILLHLANKSGQFLPQDPLAQSKTIQWLFWQVGGVGPMFGQFGHFTIYADKTRDLSYGVERYQKETMRLLTVLEKQLSDRPFIVGDTLTIADFAIFPWVVCLDNFYKAKDTLQLDQYHAINQWLVRLQAYEAIHKGMQVCSLPK